MGAYENANVWAPATLFPLVQTNLTKADILWNCIESFYVGCNVEDILQ
jgi:hypothetical protein